ncbi:MAG: sensor domain-containing diguanylate cyclase [Acidobacteria bacterium]|nr:sensor domain-containing diguanylate cyclase [Acidobacteriota bacterium]
MAEPSKQVYALREQAFSFLKRCPDCAVVFDKDWTVTWANPAFEDRFCKRKAEGSSFLSFLDAPSGHQMRDVQSQLFQSARQLELKLTTEGGKSVAVQYLFFPLTVPGSRKTLVAGIGRDRTADLALLNEVIQLNIELEKKQKELSEANARLEQFAETDQITQLYNRHYFFQVAQHFWEEARRYKLPLVAMMMDIDNFKSLNDTHGHLFGDYVLQQLSARLRTNTRKSDILARYGGEEFILLASNTDMATGLVLAERLRSAVAAELFVMGACSAPVSMSVGVSGTELGTFPTFEALLESSDNALYGAKHAGKNCVYAYADLKAANR